MGRSDTVFFSARTLQRSAATLWVAALGCGPAGPDAGDATGHATSEGSVSTTEGPGSSDSTEATGPGPTGSSTGGPALDCAAFATEAECAGSDGFLVCGWREVLTFAPGDASCIPTAREGRCLAIIVGDCRHMSCEDPTVWMYRRDTADGPEVTGSCVPPVEGGWESCPAQDAACACACVVSCGAASDGAECQARGCVPTSGQPVDCAGATCASGSPSAYCLHGTQDGADSPGTYWRTKPSGPPETVTFPTQPTYHPGWTACCAGMPPATCDAPAPGQPPACACGPTAC